MTVNLNRMKFLTQVLVLAGIVHLVNAEGQTEGRAGEVLKAEAAAPQPPLGAQVQAYATGVGGQTEGFVMVQVGEKVPAQPIVVQGRGGVGFGQAWGGGFFLPGYWQLQNEQVRKEIELVPEQEEKLQKIAKQYQEKMRQYQEKVQQIYAPLQNRDLSPEERTKLYKEMAEKAKQSQNDYQEAAKWATEEAKKVLLPQQVKALEKIELRARAGMFLQSPWMLDRMGLSEQQKEKVKKNRAELAKKIHELEVQSFEEILKVLTPEQLEKIKQPWGIMPPPGSAVQPGAQLNPAPAPKKK